MSSHADTIRDLVKRQRTHGSFYPSAHDLEALDALLADNQQLRDALEQAHADLESILPPRGHEELAQGVYFAHQRIDKALAAVRVEER